MAKKKTAKNKTTKKKIAKKKTVKKKNKRSLTKTEKQFIKEYSLSEDEYIISKMSPL